MKFKVKLFPIMSITLEVEAENHVAAVLKANEEFNPSDILSNPDLGYVDQLDNSFLVDEVGDEEYLRSAWYQYDAKDQIVAYADARQNIAVAMSAEDWSEIYYALETKKGLIEDGVYKSEEDAVWAAHLQEIIDKIGPDGQDAFDNGVIAV